MPEGSPSDALILAALERAQRHANRETLGVGYSEVVHHLGLPMHAGTGKRLRPRFRELEAAGLIVGTKYGSLVRYTITSKGRQVLKDAGEIVLPESPQHQRWREAREAAARQISGFRAEVDEMIREVSAMPENVGSETWFAFAERLERFCWRLGSATHCLREWPEPDDDAPDVEESVRRLGRRDVTRWRS